MFKKKTASGGGCPEWMVTYGDCMGLLLCFFIMLAAMSTVNAKQFQEATQSIQEALGVDGKYGPMPFEQSQTMSHRIESVLSSKRVALSPGSAEEGMEGHEYLVEHVREGLRITGAALQFDRGSAQPRETTIRHLAKFSAELRGHTTRIDVRGHAYAEPVPENSGCKDLTDLSYARAVAIAQLLASNGIEQERLRVVACGATEPVETQAYREDQLARNRRVEIIVTEVLVSELKGGASSKKQEYQ